MKKIVFHITTLIAQTINKVNNAVIQTRLLMYAMSTPTIQDLCSGMEMNTAKPNVDRMIADN